MQGALWIFHDRQRLVEIGGMLVLEINPVEAFYQDEATVSQRLVVAFGLDPVLVPVAPFERRVSFYRFRAPAPPAGW
jgi:hypothetical protein